MNTEAMTPKQALERVLKKRTPESFHHRALAEDVVEGLAEIGFEIRHKHDITLSEAQQAQVEAVQAILRKRGITIEDLHNAKARLRAELAERPAPNDIKWTRESLHVVIQSVTAALNRLDTEKTP